MMNKSSLLIILCLLISANFVYGQKISTINIVKVNANYEKEAMYYYNENWKEFRKLALQEGVISGFEIMRTATDSTNHFQLILITEYSDSTSFSKSEENFEPIIKRVSPNGPKMLNKVGRKEFLEYVANYVTLSLDAEKKERM